MSNYIYINVNEFRQNLYSKLISIIYKLYDDNSAEDHNNEIRLIISYNFYDDKKSLNDWDNPDFFSNIFPTLFSYKDGGDIASQSTNVSLYA